MTTNLTVGKIVNTYGLRGELKVISHTDFADVRFAEGSRLTIYSADGIVAPIEVTVERARMHKNNFIVKFEQFDDINEVESLKGSLLKIQKEQLLELAEDEYYYYEIVGCRVFAEDGEDLGVIVEVLSPGANDVWVAEDDKGEQLLIPVIDDVLLRVEPENKQIHIRLLEGMR